MRSISVSFQHWRHVFNEDTLTKYGSPYFAKNQAGAALMEQVYAEAERLAGHELTLTYDQIICGNEAFPEAAVADPIADLDIWDEWRSGVRSFPYPGRFSHLGISRQDDKYASPSSVGVLGEIITGFFAQVGISPWVLVRVVRRWPDLIFSEGNGAYSFVESKAFTVGNENSTGLRARVFDKEMREGLVQAVQQLNSDPFVKVWFAFTRVFDIQDMRLDLTFLELDVPTKRRARFDTLIIPAVVAQGLAERAINRASAKLPDHQVETFALNSKNEKDALLAKIRPIAEEEVRSLLIDEGIEASDNDITEIIKSMQNQLNDIRNSSRKGAPSEPREGRRFFDLKRSSAVGHLSILRPVGRQYIFFADLDQGMCGALTENWSSDWKQAATPWGSLEGSQLWRCGGAVYCVGDASLEGRSIVQSEMHLN